MSETLPAVCQEVVYSILVCTQHSLAVRGPYGDGGCTAQLHNKHEMEAAWIKQTFSPDFFSLGIS
jgi:hypothetical protein